MSKPAERERAKELRRQGWTVPDIAIELGVSKRCLDDTYITR